MEQQTIDLRTIGLRLFFIVLSVFVATLLQSLSLHLTSSSFIVECHLPNFEAFTPFKWLMQLCYWFLAAMLPFVFAWYLDNVDEEETSKK